MEIKCNKCRKRFDVADGKPGSTISGVCPRCGEPFTSVVPQVQQEVIAPSIKQPETSTSPLPLRNCPECGNDIGNATNYCPSCGASLNDKPSLLEPVATTPEVIPQQKTQISQQQPQVVYIVQQPQQTVPEKQRLHDRSKTTAGLLGILLGGLGLHKFYLGETLWGILYLVFCWTWIPAIVGFIEGIVYFSTSDEDFDEKYNYK